MPDRPSWSELHQAAKNLRDVLTRLAQVMKTGTIAEIDVIYGEVAPATVAFQQLAYPMEAALRAKFSSLSSQEKTAGAYLARVINGAKESLLELSGFGPKNVDNLNVWYNNLAQFVHHSAPLVQNETSSN